MNSQQKIDLAANIQQLYLHKEGIFYKLYNQHAMLFTANIKELKIKVKFIKAVNQEVYSCGFPVSIIEDIKSRLVKYGGIIDETEKLLTVEGTKWLREPEYNQWCRQQGQELTTTQQERFTGLTDVEDSARNNLKFLIRNCTTSSAHFLFSKSSHSQLCCGFENKKSTESVAHLRQKLSKLFLAES